MTIIHVDLKTKPADKKELESIAHGLMKNDAEDYHIRFSVASAYKLCPDYPWADVLRKGKMKNTHMFGNFEREEKILQAYDFSDAGVTKKRIFIKTPYP